MQCSAFPFRFWSTISSSSQCLCFAALSFSFSWRLITEPICANPLLCEALLLLSTPRRFFASISVPLRFCAGQINAQLCRAVASLRIALPCHALPLLILSVPSAAMRCSSMPLLILCFSIYWLQCDSFALLRVTNFSSLRRHLAFRWFTALFRFFVVFSVFLHHLLNFR